MPGTLNAFVQHKILQLMSPVHHTKTLLPFWSCEEFLTHINNSHLQFSKTNQYLFNF